MKNVGLAILLASSLLVALSASARANGDILSDAAVQALHKSICDEPIYKTKRGDAMAWTCAKPRNYPKQPEPKGALYDSCALSFIDVKGKETTAYYGEFSAQEKQALVVYTSDCEPHAMNYGGSALFRVTNSGFELLAYYPADVYVDCAVAPTKNNALQTIYCFNEYHGMGQLESGFSAIKFTPDREPHFELWAFAGNADGYADVPMVVCDKSSLNIHHFLTVGIAPNTGLPLIEAAMPSPLDEGKACERYRKGIIDPKGFEDARSFAEANHMSILRANERQLYKATISFETFESAPRITHIAISTEALQGR